MLRQCRFLCIEEVRSIPEHKVWGADRHWRKPPLFAWPHSSYAVVCQGFAVDTEVSEWASADAASLVTLLEAYGHNIAKRTTSKVTGTTTQKSGVDLVGIQFVPVLWVLEISVLVSPQNSFRDAECPGIFQVIKRRYVWQCPTNILTLPQWEKTYTGVGRQSTSR
jgi:hypothetical protein